MRSSTVEGYAAQEAPAIAQPGRRELRRLNTAGVPEDFVLPGRRCGFGVSWDAVPGRKKVDLDLQCVCVDNAGKIVDCVYYNNMKALKAITHSGDETTGEKVGIDELIWVTVPALPDTVALLVFVVAAYTGGQLNDVSNGILHLFEEKTTNEVASFHLEQSAAAVDVVAVLHRGPSGWAVRIIDEPAQQGQHFMDILPLLCETIRKFIPDAPRRQKVAFAMEKGDVIDFPLSLDTITIGLGWDVADKEDDEVDLDVSAIMLDSSGAEVETVFFGRLESDEHGIKHLGDNLTGEGDGDDEQIVVSLGAIGSRVEQVVFVINIYTPNKSFADVTMPYCRVVENSSGDELCRYSLNEAGLESALIVSKIAREVGGRFGFHALGLPCRGRTYKDSLPHVRHLCWHGTLPTNSMAEARWTCPKCEEVNRPERSHCNSCGHPK